MIKAVIYDVDGTMVDTEPLHNLAWDKALQKYNHRFTDLSKEFRSAMVGKKPIVIAQGMIDELKLSISADELLKIKPKVFNELLKTHLKEMPGLLLSVQDLKRSGYALGIGTSGSNEYINYILNTLQLRSFFDAVVTGSHIKHGKPDPETYLLVSRELHVLPQECVVIEDARNGILSAKAAGCYCIAIKNPHTASQDLSDADEFLPSLRQLTSEHIQEISKLLD